MIDRKNREYLIEIINKFLNCEISAFKFDDLLEEIDSGDQTVNHVISELWYFYDDCTDHDAHFSKEGWDYVQRLVLILQSNAEIIKEHIPLAGTRLLALLLLLAVAVIYYFYGWISIPFGLAWLCGSSISYALYRHCDKKIYRSEQKMIFPLDSYTQLSALRHMTKFRKKLFYRRNIRKRATSWHMIKVPGTLIIPTAINTVLWELVNWGFLWPLRVIILILSYDCSLRRVVIAPENIPSAT